MCPRHIHFNMNCLYTCVLVFVFFFLRQMKTSKRKINIYSRRKINMLKRDMKSWTKEETNTNLMQTFCEAATSPASNWMLGQYFCIEISNIIQLFVPVHRARWWLNVELFYSFLFVVLLYIHRNEQIPGACRNMPVIIGSNVNLFDSRKTCTNKTHKAVMKNKWNKNTRQYHGTISISNTSSLYSWLYMHCICDHLEISQVFIYSYTITIDMSDGSARISH